MSYFKRLLQNLKFYFKGLLALNLLLISATYGFLCSIFLSLIGKRAYAQWSTARFFYYLFSFVMRIYVDVDRPELLNGLPAILVGNHQSELDILMLGRVFPQKCTVTAKKSLSYLPFLGWFMTASGTFFLDRTNRQQSVDTLNKALAELKERKGGLWMFPEGTRSYSSTPTLLPFKKGAFHLAVQGQIPIIPVVTSNTSNVYSPKLKTFETGHIKVRVLDPIDTTGLTKDDVSKLCQETYDKMRAAVDEIGYTEVTGQPKKWTPPASESSTVHSDDDDSVANEPVAKEPSTATSESAALLQE